MKLYCATSNPGKVIEFRLAASPGIEIEPLPGIERVPPCEETGVTFEENAIQKACYYGAHCPGYLFAEDSGLEVAALAGAPGVYSARFAGPNATDRQNNEFLLEQLRSSNSRSARYVCVIALARAGEVMRTFRGEVEGWILEEPRGNGGFGYDPLFYFPPFGHTFGEVPREQKQTVSHRGSAVKAMLNYLHSQRTAGVHWPCDPGKK